MEQLSRTNVAKRDMSQGGEPSEDSKRELISQWISSLIDSNNSNEASKKLIGPPSERLDTYEEIVEASMMAMQQSTSGDNDTIGNMAAITRATSQLITDRSDGTGTGNSYVIVFKIEERVFVERINIYLRSSGADSNLYKIEAQDEDKSWFILWENGAGHRPLMSSSSSARVFVPAIKSCPFKTNTIRLTLSGNLILIDAIEVKGSRVGYEDPEAAEESDSNNNGIGGGGGSRTSNFGSLAKHMSNLVLNDLFADVYFEVDGRVIPAHRNILTCRSEYFRAMLSTRSVFRESLESHQSSSDPIYIPNIKYDCFKQIVNYLYTGHISLPAKRDDKVDEQTIYLICEIIRAADLMNLNMLEKLCLFHLSELINTKNCIKVYREAQERKPVLSDVIRLCYDVIVSDFKEISKCEDFCTLNQELMLRLIENVIPRLKRIESRADDHQQQPRHAPVHQQQQQYQYQQHIPHAHRNHQIHLADVEQLTDASDPEDEEDFE